MAEQKEEVSAIIYKQWNVHWKEVIKSALQAGITAVGLIVYQSIDAGSFPTTQELLMALKVGLLAMVGFVIRYWIKPTTTVIQGQIEPKIAIPQPDTVVSKDVAPDNTK